MSVRELWDWVETHFAQPLSSDEQKAARYLSCRLCGALVDHDLWNTERLQTHMRWHWSLMGADAAGAEAELARITED